MVWDVVLIAQISLSEASNKKAASRGEWYHTNKLGWPLSSCGKTL
jgi:hypothetical protein